MCKRAETLVTGDITRELGTHGLSRRLAVRVFNAILDEMKAALQRGEEVEWPFGSLKKVQHSHKPMPGSSLGRDTEIYKKQFTVALVKRKEIKDARIQKKERMEEISRLFRSKRQEIRRLEAALRELLKRDRARLLKYVGVKPIGELVVSKEPKTLVAGDIARSLRDRGLSRRNAARIFNAILGEMKDALRRGEEVELPFGTLKRVRHSHNRTRGWFLNNITTIYKQPFGVVLNKAVDIEDLDNLVQEEEEERRMRIVSELVKLREETLVLLRS
jgi:nucleoid DNA-binding protein